MKKLFAVIMCVTMLCCYMPMTAFATEATDDTDDLQGKIDNATPGATVSLEGKTYNISQLTISKDIKLEGKDGTVINCMPTGAGIDSKDKEGAKQYAMQINGKVTLKNLQITSNQGGIYSSAHLIPTSMDCTGIPLPTGAMRHTRRWGTGPARYF